MSHYEDEAQVEELKRWWKENWLALATGLALGLGGIFGWQQWQAHEDKVAADASQAYEDLKKAADANKADDAEKAA
ncbi:MAG TPA: tetratricopeptide repeat protein, partial [Nevskiaceae bacterium]|nr:tetratricopeptide repeat protein [Nevskiaceae bacterium]